MIKLEPQVARSFQPLMDLLDAYHTALNNRCLNTPGLAIGSASKTKVLIANTTNYLVDGVFKSKSTAEVDFTATTHDIPADADTVQEAVYLITLNAAGTPTVTMGDIATGAGNAKLPERPATGTPIGYVRIAVAAGATDFDATTDELDEAHITDTYVNLGGLYYNRFDAVQ